ncbi:MAG TPA: cupin domain-containing protein [Gaiellales bacterium]|nr:cupin domain-containing protein [Gaiellales bacterium]
MPYTVRHIDDIQPSSPGGAVRFVRRELGVQAFGINRFDLPPNSAGKEHDESATGQEEVSVVIAGSGHWTVDGEDVPVRDGSFIRFDPQSTRCPHAGPHGLSFISIGSPPGSYEPHGPF